MLASTLPLLPTETEISAMLFLQQEGRHDGRRDCRCEVPALMPRSALLYGYDSNVSETRKLLLESAGYDVRVANNADEALECVVSHAFEIVILCHTVPLDSVETLLFVVRALQPSATVLLLATGRPAPLQHLADGLHDTCDGPANFLNKVRKLAGMDLHIR